MDPNLLVTLIASIITGAITGAISSIGTVKALKVHIDYLREGYSRQEKAIARAHCRLDQLEAKK